MATPPFNIAQTVPGDTDIASQFPLLERTYRDVVQSWLLIDHNNLGQHKYVELMDTTGLSGFVAGFAAGIVGIWNDAGRLRMNTTAGVVNGIDHFVNGTKMSFAQAAPPLNWTLDSSVLDAVLRTASVGGGSGGSWLVSGFSAASHALTVGELPAHHHTVGNGSPGNAQFQIFVGANGGNNLPGGANATITPFTDDTGGNQGHTHVVTNDGSWRPAYLDMVVGIKNG